MNDFSAALSEALRLIGGMDAQLAQIVWLSLRVSLLAVMIAVLIALPLGALLAITRFPGRQAVVAVLNALMGVSRAVPSFIVRTTTTSDLVSHLKLLYSPDHVLARLRCDRTSVERHVIYFADLPLSISAISSAVLQLNPPRKFFLSK